MTEQQYQHLQQCRELCVLASRYLEIMQTATDDASRERAIAVLLDTQISCAESLRALSGVAHLSTALHHGEVQS